MILNIHLEVALVSVCHKCRIGKSHWKLGIYGLLMGTDMHNTGNRMPDTKEAMSWMRTHLDRTYLKKITKDNALRITENKIIK